MNTVLIADILLCGLLTATVVTCIALSRKLNAVRQNHDSLKTLIGELDVTAARAEAAIQGLKQAAGTIGLDLQKRTNEAKALSKELNLVVGTGQALANRMAQPIRRAG